jgi:tetratricopeptide (TPR) repeat protein
MEFVILGSTALYVDGARLPLGAAKQRGMLAILLYHVGEPVRTDTLVDLLWPGRTPDECRELVYTLASRVRAALNRVGMGNALTRVPTVAGYRLDLDPLFVDFHRFRHMMGVARDAAARESYDTAVALLTAAIELWKDEPLADLRGARAEHLRRSMKDALSNAHRLLADYLLRLGRHHAVLALLEPLLLVDDLDEMLAQSWINALCAAGRDDDARSYLTAFRRRFRKEMRSEAGVALPRPARRPTGGGLTMEPPAEGVRDAAATPVAGLPAVPVGPRQLPKDISDFTGHQELLVELDALTDPERRRTGVVVLSGMPGVGKTTLCVHFGHRQRHRFPDGQLYLNANAYGPVPGVDPDEALGRFLEALDVPTDRIPSGREQRRDRLDRLLAGRRVLIVLDNVRDSRQVRPLLTASETCVTLITSRTRLKGLSIREGVPNLTVPSLAEGDCLALLSRMVGARRAAEDPVALRALARLSGGLPLALRIIGEHVVERPRARVADLVEELSNRLLDGDAEDDESSLRTVFAWSYEALRPAAARLFRLLGLHPAATIGPEAAAALAGIGVEQSEHLLNGLAKAHLINHDTARRYRFHDLLRLYAADRARCEEPAQERDRAIRRLLDWYVLSAANAAAVLAPQSPPVPDLPSPDGTVPKAFSTDAEAMKWCEAERGNLLAVTRWAAACGLHRHAWQLPGAVVEMLDRYGRQDDLLELLQVGQASADVDGHRQGQLGILNDLGTIYFALHEYGRAAEAFTTAQTLAREIGYVDVEMACSHNLATVHLRSGRVDVALGIIRRVLRDCRTRSNRPGEAAALHRLGDAYRRMKRYDSAIGRYREALSIRKAIGAARGQAMTLAALAALYAELEDWRQALDHCTRALRIYDHTRDEPVECDTLAILADAERALGMRREAVDHARRAVAISEGIGDSARRARALAVLAHALAAAGDVVPARRACGQALTMLDESTDPEHGALRDGLAALRDSLGSPAGP